MRRRRRRCDVTVAPRILSTPDRPKARREPREGEVLVVVDRIGWEGGVRVGHGRDRQGEPVRFDVGGLDITSPCELIVGPDRILPLERLPGRDLLMEM